MISKIIALWNNTDQLLREFFKYRTVALVFIVVVTLVHSSENSIPLSYVQYSFIAVSFILPSLLFYITTKSHDPLVTVLNETIFDLLWCGVFISSIHYSIAPSFVIGLVSITNYVSAKGLYKIYRLLLIPAGCIPIVLLQGFHFINGTGFAEVTVSLIYGLTAFSILGNIVFRTGRAVRRRNAALEEKQKELAESNAVKDKLFSIIAHDIKAPLNSLKGFLSLLNSKSLSANEQTELLKNIDNHFNHTSELIDNVLLWAQTQMNGITLSKELIDVKQVADKAVELLQVQATKKEISVENRTPSHKTLADSNMLELVFRNLIANAIKFTGQNGKVTITSVIENGVATFCIEDNGVGISKEAIETLFRLDKTFTTLGTEKEKGSGLGLSLCKDFITRHGGNLWLESEVSKGTKFYFTLPSIPYFSSIN
jgi:signal transduction histidine kinase